MIFYLFYFKVLKTHILKSQKENVCVPSENMALNYLYPQLKLACYVNKGGHNGRELNQFETSIMSEIILLVFFAPAYNADITTPTSD